MNADDKRRYSPAAERNQGPILAVLQRVLPAQGLALEIAAGTGQHAAHFAGGLPGWNWLPSDGEALSLDSITAWCGSIHNVLPALHLNLLASTTPAIGWPGVPLPLDAIFCANLLHISPWATCAALMQGAARHLTLSGLLITYGPYLVDGENTAQSNLAFDADLQLRNPAWGLRRLDDVAQQAAAAGLVLSERVQMPANNLLLVWARGP